MKNYTLVFEENFTHPTINTDVFTLEVAGTGFGNKEAQFYTNSPKNVEIVNQQLVIRALKEKHEHCEYTSAKLTTKHKRHFQYGRLEVTAKLPKGKGTWPAIWLLGMPNNADGPWPLRGEIDIMEHVGKDEDRVHFSLHSGTYNHRQWNHPTHIETINDVTSTFYTYGIDWEEDKIAFYVNDQVIQTFTRKPGDNLTSDWPFNQPYYLILNLAVGGTWGGEIDDSIFPQEFIIDSIRYYQKEN